MAADVSFVGRWKVDLTRSTITGFQEKVEDLGNHELKFSFGDDAETYIVDGKEHPTRHGSLRTVTLDGPNHWKSVGKREGKIVSSESWQVSGDGKTFTVKSEGTRPDGSTYKNEVSAKRVAGTSGIVGTWENTEPDPNLLAEWDIEPFEGDGLDFAMPSLQEHDPVKFDGKDYPSTGPRVAPGSTTAGKHSDDGTLELYYKVKDKLYVTEHLELSADGKTLTSTISYPGIEKKEIHVYARQ